MEIVATAYKQLGTTFRAVYTHKCHYCPLVEGFLQTGTATNSDGFTSYLQLFGAPSNAMQQWRYIQVTRPSTVLLCTATTGYSQLPLSSERAGCQTSTENCMLLKLTAHLSHWSQTPLKLELIDSHVGWLSALCSSANLPLPPSMTYTHTVNDVPLFCLVSQSASLIWPRGSRCTMYSCQLSVLPASHTQQKAKQIWLLLTPKFLQILIGTHFCPRKNRKGAVNITVTYLQLSFQVDCSNKTQIYPPSSPLLSSTSCTHDQWES